MNTMRTDKVNAYRLSDQQTVDVDGYYLKKHRFVKVDQSAALENSIVYTADGDAFEGVTICNVKEKTGEHLDQAITETIVSVMVEGIANVEASAAITRGQEIGPDADGKAKPAAGTGYVALNDALAGEFVSFKL